jgi:hypothetical protein
VASEEAVEEDLVADTVHVAAALEEEVVDLAAALQLVVLPATSSTSLTFVNPVFFLSFIVLGSNNYSSHTLSAGKI